MAPAPVPLALQLPSSRHPSDRQFERHSVGLKHAPTPPPHRITTPPASLRLPPSRHFFTCPLSHRPRRTAHGPLDQTPP
ncbi:hypothetical protein E2562_021736 [Oryza meyeriana var. granulata]|uniref:Uncharacterized protein n=1 Tax=Oryza meyeriana var. granulata TaxID=110450 RepID=A0A6G1DYT6_9ORYZ|nr:hypothetical protein E2562_021736 [Oryza meyeriana var. granulata]